jgi:hypothetical protein
MTTTTAEDTNIENTIPLGNGVRVIRRGNGIEVRRDINDFSEEIVCNITDVQIAFLQKINRSR